MSTAYDQIAYPAHSHPQTHPDHVAAMATLFGIEPPPAPSARVLELGCGDGADLAAIAYAWPDTTCVGVDLSRDAIARGKQLVDELKLTNLELVSGDLRTLDRNGPFDFIIAHGLYSWVPPETADAALQLSARLLGDNGLAYFSYDVFPGAHLKLIARDFMRFAVPQNAAPLDAAKAAREAMRSLADSASNDDLKRLYGLERDRIAKISDAALIHDDVGEHCRPVTFTDFAAHAQRHGLRFVCEADPVDSFPPNLSPQAHSLIERMSGGDLIRGEQASDFIRGRRFRQSILCRAPVEIDARLNPDRFSMLYFATQLKPEPSTGATTLFRGHAGATVTLNHPSAVAALKILSQAWPAAMRFDELRRRSAAWARVADDEHHAHAVAEILKRTAGARVVEVYREHPPAATRVPERPAASALARSQSSRGELVTGLTGRSVNLKGQAARLLLELLDGTRTVSDVANELRRRLDQPKLTVAEVEARVRELIDLRLILPPTK